MAYILADNILSPLGLNTEENYRAVRGGRSALRRYETGTMGVQEAFTASLLEAMPTLDGGEDGLSRFETMALYSVTKALGQVKVNVGDGETVLILSSTKGNIEHIYNNVYAEKVVSLTASAQRIARIVGIKTMPIVVCNACISGLSALLLGARLVDMGAYRHAVVCGADCPGRFIVSGFQSLKALSVEECRPFDMERLGLNLGEAAATVVLSREKTADGQWHIDGGAVRNDAFHLTSPSKDGEGLRLALHAALGERGWEGIGFVNAHGTATMFNDQMEGMALQRAGVGSIPVNALKGYYGHTMGTAGLLETILSMHAADDHTVLATRGFEERGVSGKIHITKENLPTEAVRFVKMLSGFGGCNAATVLSNNFSGNNINRLNANTLRRTHHINITPTSVCVDGQKVTIVKEGDASQLTALYKQLIGGYPKFYKMDLLSRLGFVATELLLQAEGKPRFEGKVEGRAVVLFNRSSSIEADRRYAATTADANTYYPSPSIFVYTLPNIVAGEIAIRNGYQGETSFYVMPEKDENMMQTILEATFTDAKMTSAISGWLDAEDENHYQADLYIIERN